MPLPPSSILASVLLILLIILTHECTSAFDVVNVLPGPYESLDPDQDSLGEGVHDDAVPIRDSSHSYHYQSEPKQHKKKYAASPMHELADILMERRADAQQRIRRLASAAEQGMLRLRSLGYASDERVMRSRDRLNDQMIQNAKLMERVRNIF